MHALPALLAAALYTATFMATGSRSAEDDGAVTVALTRDRLAAWVTGAAEGAAERADLEFNALVLRARAALAHGETAAAERLLLEAASLDPASELVEELRRLLDLVKAGLETA